MGEIVVQKGPCVGKSEDISRRAMEKYAQQLAEEGDGTSGVLCASSGRRIRALKNVDDATTATELVPDDVDVN